MPLDPSTSIQMYGVNVWDEGTQEDFVRLGASSATRTILCAWTDRITIINNIRGGGSILTGGAYYYTSSQAYPDAPFLAFDSIRVEGIAGDTGLNVGPNGLVGYKYARIRIKYKSLDYIEGTTTGTLSLDYSTELVAVPQSDPAFQWVSDGSPVPAQDCPSIRVSTVTLVQTRKNLATIPTALIQSLSGCVNSATFLGGSPGTVLFDGARSDRRLTTTGAENWDMTYRFIYRSVGWNSFLRPGVAGSATQYEAVTGIAGGPAPYASGDLNQLLQ